MISVLVAMFAVARGQRFDQDGLCEAEGFFRDPEACTRFYRCVTLGRGYQVRGLNRRIICITERHLGIAGNLAVKSCSRFVACCMHDLVSG